VILFSEYRATQNWLVEILALEGFGGQDRLKTMFGGMEKDKREAVKAAFQAAPNVSPVRILVATDAASEGIDLQNHCDLMIHVEIPWNPNVLEQRNGRIDRHGQKSKEVFIWHPVGAGYREREFHEDIRTGDLEGDLEFLMVAARKVQTIRQDLGKVGHVIADQVEQAMFGRRSRLDTAQAEKEAAAVSRQLAVEKRFQEKVARLHQQLQESRETFRMSPENIRMTVKVALEIIISGHQELRSATDGRFQDLIVIGITTDLQIPRNLDDVCTSRDKPDKCFCLLGWIYKASHQPWPVKNLYDFGELRQ